MFKNVHLGISDENRRKSLVAGRQSLVASGYPKVAVCIPALILLLAKEQLFLLIIQLISGLHIRGGQRKLYFIYIVL